jgi:hypothetical protein
VRRAANPDYRRGLIYTVHPRLLTSLDRGIEYRIVASVRRRRVEDGAPAPYDELYARAQRLLSARVDELRDVAPPGQLCTGIAAHAWFSMSLPAFRLAGAAITLALRSTPDLADVPQGHAPPTPEQLRAPLRDARPTGLNAYAD